MIVRVIPAGDLALVNGNFVFLPPGPEYTRQKLAARLKFFLGEWFLDRRLGIPYYRHVFVKNPDMNVVRRIFTNVITRCPGVLALTKLELDHSPSERTLGVAFVATVEGGEVRVNPGDADFILNLA